MNLLLKVFFSLPYYDYFVILGLICGIYSGLVAPLIFRYWIIPKIESRYQTKLKYDSICYSAIPFSNWFIPCDELSYYIFFRYIKWNEPFKNSAAALEVIGYDVKKASSLEITLSIITVIAHILFIISGIIVSTK